jgi:hypothetical protein
MTVVYFGLRSLGNGLDLSAPIYVASRQDWLDKSFHEFTEFVEWNSDS